MNAQSPALGLLLLAAAAGSATAADPATLARAGGEGLAPCASCHGAAGEGQGDFPRLAGIDASYLARQLDDFASDARANAIMTPIAKALAAEDRVGLARFYGGLPVPVSPAAAAAEPGTAAIGERLALRGDWSRGIPACVQCHGPEGRGVGAAFPAIAGQRPGYLRSQLTAFRDGQRHNDPLELMRAPAAALTDEEISALAGWFSARPARRPGGSP